MINLDQFIWELEEESPQGIDLKDPYIKNHVIDVTCKWAHSHFNDTRTWEYGHCLNDLADIEFELVKHGLSNEVACLVQSYINVYYMDYNLKFEKKYEHQEL